jgi:hypothetical protein
MLRSKRRPSCLGEAVVNREGGSQGLISATAALNYVLVTRPSDLTGYGLSKLGETGDNCPLRRTKLHPLYKVRKHKNI